jgi:Sec-independent protein translocase protein TatA
VRNRRKGKHAPPYETLSDIAMGSLGVFIVLVVVIIILSSSSQSSSTFEKIESANNQYRNNLSNVKDQLEKYQNSNYLETEMARLQREYQQSQDKLEQQQSQLESKINNLKTKEEQLNQLNSIVKLLNQDERMRNQIEQDIRVLNRDLKYLNNRETGKSWDLSGTPYIEYGTWSGENDNGEYKEYVLVGNEGVFTINDFLIITNTIDAPRDSEDYSTFVFRPSNTNSKYNQDQIMSKETNIVRKKLGKEGGWETAKTRGKK